MQGKSHGFSLDMHIVGERLCSRSEETNKGKIGVVETEQQYQEKLAEVKTSRRINCPLFYDQAMR